MTNIDFSAAFFSNVDFSGGLDLIKYIFPNQKDILFIRNGNEIFNKAIEKIREGQSQIIIEKDIIDEVIGKSFGTRFIELIGKLNSY